MKSAIHLTLDFRRPEVVPRSLCGSEAMPRLKLLLGRSEKTVSDRFFIPAVPGLVTSHGHADQNLSTKRRLGPGARDDAAGCALA